MAALVGSAVLVVVGLWWRARPAAYPFGPDDRYQDLSLMVHVAAGRAGVLLVLSGLVSGAVAVSRLLGVRGPRPVQAASFVVACATAVSYAYALPDIQLLIMVAYGLTLSLPAIGVFFWGSRRDARRRGGPAGIETARRGIAAAVLVFVLTIAAIVVLGRPWEWDNGEDGVAAPWRPLVLLASVLIGVTWGVVGLRILRELRGSCVRCGRPGPAWTDPRAAARWGRVVTWAAALTPLPYVFARLTWLTPWPYGESIEHLAANPALWAFGLGLAAAGELGTWLTLGLIKGRGEIFPAWLPVWGRRPVPVMVAVVPGLFVALLMCIGGHSVVQQAFGPGTTWEDHTLVLFVPLPVWGPLLALGAVAYWYRRRPSCTDSGLC